jgi:type III secretion protein V
MSSMGRITQALLIVSRRGDLAIAIIVLVAVVMMIVPLPTPLVDALITANLAASVLILLTAFYIAEPLDLSALPSLVLIATLFRLAIVISTARLILLQADAGQIISAFGSFVVGGNVAVGLVVFVIITVAQFVVITKGAERVAEVAARFTLDALPGRQMSIDGDLRGGDIDRAEARRLRGRLTRESHLYGAMDGAMKFVRGDAIAGIIIIGVNLIGGLAIGSMQRGLSLSEAIETYSLLTVGDGLVALIPALLISVAAGTVVTRVGTSEQLDLGTEILQQLTGDPRALFLAGAILLVLAWIPGFPWPTFVVLAVLFGVAGYLTHRRRVARAAVQHATVVTPEIASQGNQAALPQPAPGTDVVVARGRYRLAVRLGRELGQRVKPEDFSRETTLVRQALTADLGLDMPAVELRVDDQVNPNHFGIELEGVPVLGVDVPGESLLVESEAVDLELLAIPYAEAPRIGSRRPAMWVEEQYQPAIAAAGIEALAPTQMLAKWLAHMLLRYATQLIGIQETREILLRAEKEYPELTKEVQKIATLQKTAEIFRRLLDENVPIGNLRLILEALAEWGPREQDTILLVEHVRVALRRQICFRCADRDRVIVAYMLERSAEETLRAAVRSTAAGAFLNIPDAAARPIVERIKHAVAAASERLPVVLTSMDVRRHVRSLLIRHDLDASVLSYQELAPEFSVEPLAEPVGGPRESLGVATEAAE